MAMLFYQRVPFPQPRGVFFSPQYSPLAKLTGLAAKGLKSSDSQSSKSSEIYPGDFLGFQNGEVIGATVNGRNPANHVGCIKACK